jgi:TolB protein
MFMRLTAMALVFVFCLAGGGDGLSKSEFALESTIAFTSSRDNPVANPFLAGATEIYLMSPDGANLRRLTDNTASDAFPALSPDGKKIVFDSNRKRAEGEPINTYDLFVMNTDGSEQMFLTRGSSATWSPDSKNIAFHASASGTGLPTRTDPGPPTSDSDIFVANVDDLLAGVARPKNLTNSPKAIDDDPDWSPDGRRIVFTSHPVTDDPQRSNLAEIYLINVDGTGLTRLTFNSEEERGPNWSPDGSRIVYLCRIGGGTSDFEICDMKADGSDRRQLTDNTVFDGTPTFSPNGQQILFHRTVAPGTPGVQQLWLMNADGTGQTQLTNPPGVNNLANWGVVRVHIKLSPHGGRQDQGAIDLTPARGSLREALGITRAPMNAKSRMPVWFE